MRSSEKWTILAGHWTIKLGRQNGRLLHWRKSSCVSTKTLKAIVAASRSYIKYECAVVQQNFSLIATAHDCETGEVKTGFWGPFSDFQILYTLQAGVGQFPSRSLHAHLYWWSGTRRRARGHNSGSGPSEAHRSAGSCGGPEATGTYTQVSYCQEVWVWWVISDRWVKRIGLVNSDLCQW